MSGIRYFAALLCLPLFAGCSQLAGMPSGEPFPEQSLRKAKSAAHWDVIAGDVAAQTASLKDQPEFNGRNLYVVPSNDNSDFSKGFQSMLISKLVNGGMNVATIPDGAVHVKYEAQVVRHLAGQGNYKPGTVAALAGGILVARQISVGGASATSKAAGTTALIAGAELLAAYAELRSATNTEVIITTSIVDKNRFLMRKTDVYYVEDAEGVMFETPFRAQTRTMGVVGQ